MNFLANLPFAFATAEATKIEYNFIQKFFIWILETLYKFTEAIGSPNWILTIFIFTIIVRLLMQPLLSKQMRSSRRMQMLAPQLEVLKKRYGADQVKLNAEMMKLYKAHNIKPTAGCLPMLIQLLVMWCLYSSLRTYVPADPSFFNFPLLGVDNLSMLCSQMTMWNGWSGWLLPVLCGLSTFVSQYVMIANKKDKTQRMMLIITPIMFAYFVHQFQVLVAIYWFFYNIISLLIQYPLMKRWERIDRAEIERVQAEREAKERARKEKKAAAKAKAEEKRLAALKSGKPAPPVERPEEFDFFAEDEDGNTDFNKMIYDWVEWKGWTIRRKKEKLHPWSEEEEIVETIITDEGEELSADQAHHYFDVELKAAYQEQAKDLSSAVSPLGGLFGKRKKKQQQENAVQPQVDAADAQPEESSSAEIKNEGSAE